MKNLRVIFMGTPAFSVSILKELIINTNVVMVVTSPDAFIGRKKILTPCEVKSLALDNNIKVISPNHIKDSFTEIKDMNPDIIITCAYGQIVPENILNLPKLGCINIHASLLPKYRGGAPIHHVLMDGETETGITIMYMDKGMDSGDIITEKIVTIEKDDTLDSLSLKLSNLGSKMIIKELPNIINGTSNREKQDISKVTFAPIIKREDEHLDFNLPAEKVFNKVRALYSHPLANFIMDNIEYKIGSCEIVSATGLPGTIVSDDFIIMCKDQGIKVLTIKPMGKNLMTIKEFKNGYHDSLIGKRLQ